MGLTAALLISELARHLQKLMLDKSVCCCSHCVISCMQQSDRHNTTQG